MKVIFTLQAKENLQRSINFLRVRGIPEEKIEEIADKLLFRIDSLADKTIFRTTRRIPKTTIQTPSQAQDPYKTIYYELTTRFT